MVHNDTLPKSNLLFESTEERSPRQAIAALMTSKMSTKENAIPKEGRTYEIQWPTYGKAEKRQTSLHTTASSAKTEIPHRRSDSRMASWRNLINSRSKGERHRPLEILPATERRRRFEVKPDEPEPTIEAAEHIENPPRLSLRGLIESLTSPVKSNKEIKEEEDEEKNHGIEEVQEEVEQHSPGHKCRNRESTPYKMHWKRGRGGEESPEPSFLENNKDQEHGLYKKIMESPQIVTRRHRPRLFHFDLEVPGLVGYRANESEEEEESLLTIESEEEDVDLPVELDAHEENVSFPQSRSGENDLNVDYTNPYHSVFNAQGNILPDKETEYKLEQENAETRYNLIELMRLVLADPSKDITEEAFNSTLLDLSRDVLDHAYAKISSYEHVEAELKLRSEDIRVLTKQSTEMYESCVNLNKKLDDNTNQMEKLKLEKQFALKKIESLEHTISIFKSQERATIEASLNTRRATRQTREITEIKINDLNHKLEVLTFYKDASLQFLWDLEGKLSNLLPAPMIRTFHERADTLRSKLSLRTICGPNATERVCQMKENISEFYSEGVDSNIISGILTNWPQVIRSNSFLTKKLVELRVQINENKTIQSTNERAKGEFNRKRYPARKTMLAQEFLKPFDTYDSACYY